MNELVLGAKKFSMKDQVDFANFCGDFNSIHLEPIKARKTIPGECIAHGINSFLCALEFLSINKKFLTKFGKSILCRESIPGLQLDSPSL